MILNTQKNNIGEMMDSETKSEDLLGPIIVKEGFLATTDGLKYVLPRIVEHTSYYWWDYKDYVIRIGFKSPEEQESVLDSIVYMINKVLTPTRDLLDKIPRKIFDRKLALSRGRRMYPSIFSNNQINYIHRIGEHKLDSLVVIFENFDFDIEGMDVIALINNRDEAMARELSILLSESARAANDIAYDYLAKKMCAHCDKDGCTRRCSMCSMYYCSVECQNTDWKATHKRSCKAWRAYKLHRTSISEVRSMTPRVFPSRPRLISLIAGHISKIDYFDKLVRSIVDQTTAPSSVVISISKDSGAMLPPSLEKFKEISTNVKLVQRPKKKSLFSHYDYLCSLLVEEPPDDTWIVFSEDDGIWHNHRIEEYEDRIHTMILNNSRSSEVVAVKSLLCGEKTKVGDTISVRTDDETVLLWGSAVRYVDYCVKLKYLRLFMRYCPQDAKNNPYCGTLFTNYIKRIAGNGSDRIIYPHYSSTTVWMYSSERPFVDIFADLSLLEEAEFQWDWLLASLCGATMPQRLLESHTKVMVTKGYPPPTVKQALANALKNSPFTVNRLKHLYGSTLNKKE